MMRRVRAFSVIALVVSAVVVLIGAVKFHGDPARPRDVAMTAVDTSAWQRQRTTVLTCEPLTFGAGSVFGVMKFTLRSFAPTHGKPVAVPTNTDLTYAGLLAGRDVLNDYIRATPGKKIVFAYSRGAQFASEWLRAYADAPDAPSPSDLSFVLIGNPQRRLGGTLGTTLDGVRLLPTPDDTRYPVTDLTRRRDGWSNADNWPARTTLAARTELASRGKFVVHANYAFNSLDDPRNMVRAVVGNTTYLVGP